MRIFSLRVLLVHILCLGIVFLGLILPALASAPQGAPVDRVRNTLETALRILNDPALQGSGKEAARRQGIRKLIAERFNYTEMAARSLDAYWNKLTEKQRQEFVAIFGELFERSYSRLVLDSLPGRQVIYTGESGNGTHAVVNTIIVDKQGDRMPVDYQLQRPHDRWEMYDVVIDGVSIVTNYQSQFNKIIQASSYDDLVKRMRIKRDEE